jgi:hypothetical protein
MNQDLETFQIGRAPYTDAELYRLIVAQTIQSGSATCKADFDSQVRKIGRLEAADKVIALTDRRPGCAAKLAGERFRCECGATWSADDQEIPACITRKK